MIVTGHIFIKGPPCIRRDLLHDGFYSWADEMA